MYLDRILNTESGGCISQTGQCDPIWLLSEQWNSESSIGLMQINE